MKEVRLCVEDLIFGYEVDCLFVVGWFVEFLVGLMMVLIGLFG